jgi:hypothetical protein
MSIFSAIGSFVAGPFGALASTALSSVLGAAAASQRRKQAIKDQDNQFVRMRNAAQKAGFNPLTVMRNGGAQMFGGVPTFSKAGFMQDFVQQGFNAWTTHADNDPLKKYNKEVRDLTIESMKSQIALDKAQRRSIGVLSAPALGSVTGKGNNPMTDDRTAVTTALGTTTPANTSDAEVAETRYGDIAQEVFGAANLISDLYTSGILSAEQFANKTGTPFGFNNPKRGEMLKSKYTTKTNNVPALSTFNFGPNYRDRISLDGWVYNY